MHNHQHPDTEQLDRLRAGLLDDRPREKSAMEQHLAECEACRTHAGIWSQLDTNAMGPRVNPRDIDTALQAARRQALDAASATHKHRHSLLPYAAAASLALAVTVGLWTIQPGIDTTNIVAGNEQAVPDLYEDLDFYLWLATENENGTDNGST
ncbi:MAG: hypothetical protein OEY45_05620 [Gammaproteobacteria bacterium]|nr:hypothetical protein [Gammaproteobacteria bacterium]